MQVRGLCPVLAVVGYGELMKAEKYFRSSTCNGPILKINIEKIRSNSCSDLEVITAYNTLLSNSELSIDKHVAKDVLQSILDLYITVRSFSFAKDIVQCCKSRQNNSKIRHFAKK